MDSPSDSMRQKAAQAAQASAVLLEQEDFDTSPKKQVMAIIGQVNSVTLNAIADAVDYLSTNVTPVKLNPSLQALVNKTSAMRNAAAKGFSSGDWNDFDRIAAGSESG